MFVGDGYFVQLPIIHTKPRFPISVNDYYGAPQGLLEGCITSCSIHLSIWLLMTNLFVGEGEYMGMEMGWVPRMTWIDTFVGWFPS
jgi:hypothetical protein